MDAAADNVAGGVIAEPRGGGGGARVAGQQGIFARDYSGTRPAQSRVS
jgi:hypothetical protein